MDIASHTSVLQPPGAVASSAAVGEAAGAPHELQDGHPLKKGTFSGVVTIPKDSGKAARGMHAHKRVVQSGMPFTCTEHVSASTWSLSACFWTPRHGASILAPAQCHTAIMLNAVLHAVGECATCVRIAGRGDGT